MMKNNEKKMNKLNEIVKLVTWITYYLHSPQFTKNKIRFINTV